MTSTPGPWDWMAVGANASGGHHLYIIDATKRKIAALWGKAEEKEANARLIAAAPNMIEALLLCQREWRGDGWVVNQETMRIAVDAAISLAMEQRA